jgi:uncharacterized protein with PIN domain
MTSARPCDPHYGKGDTRFNLGDPLAYLEPLMFKGADFPQTDEAA